MRSLICNKIIQAAHCLSRKGKTLELSNLLPFLEVSHTPSSTLEYRLPLVRTRFKEELPKELDYSQLVKNISTDEDVTGAYFTKKPFPSIVIKVCHQESSIKKFLNEICDNRDDFWKSSPLLKQIPKQKVLVEFSSPNIAKPFHMGHLRSTIVGNFIANLMRKLGHDVVSINYLGDWGTQFGLLKYGYDLKCMSEADLQDDPIRTLYTLYVEMHNKVEESPEIMKEANRVFHQMEEGDEKHLSVWRVFRDLSLNAYDGLYRRLNVAFDEYHGESMYARYQSEEVIQLLKKRGLLTQLEDGGPLVFAEEGKKPVTLVKSDGSTLYLTRDVAAALHRLATYSADRMIYVVDSTQRKHFVDLKRIIHAIDPDAASTLEHVPFGLISGMSTRKGTAVFLEDVLDRARDLWTEAQKTDRYTEFDDIAEAKEAADVSGTSAVALAFLRLRRVKDVTFDLDDTLKTSGKFSASLQYTHCRLLRLERNCGVAYDDSVAMDTLVEPEVMKLLRYILRFDEVIFESYEKLDSSPLVNYMEKFSAAINSCYGKLPVANAPHPTAQQRLKLFRAARHVLYAGLKFLGLNPLEKM